MDAVYVSPPESLATFSIMSGAYGTFWRCPLISTYPSLVPNAMVEIGTC
ncbi:Uncharacterised protein [Mycobacteroides abscessus subsp. abscessus]|nr:Uncharacterised protein [Mycobacteroides abscessus subsp. abscessus]SKY58225.1 Uncharacterised protein [Mycobacteroides abscessus subsp. abscessus]